MPVEEVGPLDFLDFFEPRRKDAFLAFLAFLAFFAFEPFTAGSLTYRAVSVRSGQRLWTGREVKATHLLNFPK